MNSLLSRTFAVLSTAVLMSAGVAVSAVDAAHADAEPDVAVHWSDWDQGTDFLLSGDATAEANATGNTSDLCGDGTNAAIAAGIPLPDEARKVCHSELLDCVHDALNRGNSLSGTRFYTGFDGTHEAGEVKCLVR